MGLGLDYERDVVITKVDNGYILVYYIQTERNGYKSSEKQAKIVATKQELLDLVSRIV